MPPFGFLKKGSETFQVDLLFPGWFEFSSTRQKLKLKISKCNGTEECRCVCLPGSRLQPGEHRLIFISFVTNNLCAAFYPKSRIGSYLVSKCLTTRVAADNKLYYMKQLFHVVLI